MKHSLTSKTKQKYSFDFDALGTKWAIETPAEIPSTTKRRIKDRLEEYEQTYSRFREDSLISQLQTPGVYEFPSDFPKLFTIYQTCYRLTGGLMTPLIGSVLEDAGYDKEYSLVPKKLHTPPMLDTMAWDGLHTLTTSVPVGFDVGAAGKGYAVDIVAEILERDKIAEYVIDASGDIRQRGNASEKIGLEDPFDAAQVIGIAHLENKSLCASASNRRAWRGLHHIFNPQTLEPVENIVATWVVAHDTLTADAMATALFFVESPDQLKKEFNFSYVRVFGDRTVDYSSDFEGQLFT